MHSYIKQKVVDPSKEAGNSLQHYSNLDGNNIIPMPNHW